MKSRFFAGLLVLSFSSALQAQAGIQSAPSRVEIFGGYSLAARNFSAENDPTNGWNVAFNFKPAPRFGLAGDFAGYYLS